MTGAGPGQEVTSYTMAKSETSGAFVTLPVGRGGLVRVLGPRADQAAVAVEPLVKLDEPLGVLQAYVGGVCRADGELVQPVEIMLARDPAGVPPSELVPLSAILRAFRALPELYAALPVTAGFELLCRAVAESERPGPLLYCRKRHCVFAARSPNTADALTAVPESDQEADAGGVPLGLLSWDGPGEDGRSVALYGGGDGGSCPLGDVRSLDQMISDQGGVVRRGAGLADADPNAFAKLSAVHPCCTCEERERCYPEGDGYSYALDRLIVINAGDVPLTPLPLGEWQLDEAARMIGGLRPGELFAEAGADENDLDRWRRARAVAIESSGPALLLAGETDGRELIEVARVKLALIADVLEQLDAAWRIVERPHLCWNDETVRLAWRKPTATPAANWGFAPLLRKIGMQPGLTIGGEEGVQLAYPPAFSDRSLLPAEVVEALRSFGQPRSATVFVKSAKAEGENSAEVHVLLEDTGIAWELCAPGDVMTIAGDGWQATLSPAAQHNPDDGAGLPFVGRAVGQVAGLRESEQIDGCECRWYPRFDEAVDLHAVGMLLLDTLLAHDECGTKRLREELAGEREELTRACLALELEQREGKARGWIAERSENDSPGSVWSRRNLLQQRADRSAARLDAFPAAIWQPVIALAMRLTAAIPGFSYCADRSQRAPRTSDGLLLPLLELRGLIALLDDRLFGRSAPGSALREAIKATG